MVELKEIIALNNLNKINRILESANAMLDGKQLFSQKDHVCREAGSNTTKSDS